jgi:hypothetical protein
MVTFYKLHGPNQRVTLPLVLSPSRRRRATRHCYLSTSIHRSPNLIGKETEHGLLTAPQRLDSAVPVPTSPMYFQATWWEVCISTQKERLNRIHQAIGGFLPEPATVDNPAKVCARNYLLEKRSWVRLHLCNNMSSWKLYPILACSIL